MRAMPGHVYDVIWPITRRSLQGELRFVKTKFQTKIYSMWASTRLLTSKASRPRAPPRIQPTLTTRHMRSQGLWDPPKKRTLTGPWLGLAALAVIGGAVVVWFWNKKKKRHEALSIKTAGSARIGGNWSMVDDEGHPVSAASFYGKYPLIYFGFTFCPDVCPEELRKMSLVIDQIDKDVGPGVVQPIFVSLDPWRDSVEQMFAYSKQYNKRFRGLTGTPGQCEIMAHNFRVYTTTDRDTEDKEDYIVDHSIFMYFMDKEGKFVDLFGVDKEPEEITERIKDHLVARGDYKEPLLRRIRNFFTIED